MTYADKEESVYGSIPIELHRFQRGGTISVWTYSASTVEPTISGEVYEAIPINRTKIELSQDTIRNSLTITLPTSSEFIQSFTRRAPSDIFNYVLSRYHEDDDNLLVLWVGRVLNVSFKEDKADVLCESIITSLKRTLLKRIYQTTCPLVLYDNICGANSADFSFETTVLSVSGSVLTGLNILDQPDGYYNGGYVETTSGGITNRVFIITQIGNELTMGSVLSGAEIGSTIKVFPGCNHSTDDCFNKFNNILNYGGYPWIPEKNPMAGTPIF